MPDVVEPSATSVRSVVRTAKVLKAFGEAQAEFGVNELGRRLDLPAPTVYRILATLVSEGFVEQSPATGKYSLGSETLFLGLACLSRKHLGTECLPVMRGLAGTTGETVNLGALRGRSVVYIQQVESPQPLRFAREVGTHVPLHSSALGKLLLAFLPDVKQRELVDDIDLTRYTPVTIVDRAGLLEHLRQVREQGYSITNEEYISDLRAVALPVRDHTGEVIAGLSIMGPSSRLTLDRLEECRPLVLEAALQLSEQLGWRRLSPTDYP